MASKLFSYLGLGLFPVGMAVPARELEGQVVAWFKDFHEHPELGLEVEDDRPFELDFVGNDVRVHAAVDRAEGERRRALSRCDSRERRCSATIPAVRFLVPGVHVMTQLALDSLAR